MMRLWAFLLICLTFEPCLAEPELARDKVVDELTEALTALGSFRADYHGTSPKQSVEITVMVHRECGYCLVTASGTDANVPDMAIVVDNSEMDTERAAMKWLLIVDGKATKATLSLPEMAEKLDNPVGLFLFMARQFGSVAGIDAGKEMTFTPSHPAIALGLGQETLKFSVGLSCEYHDFGVSWLDPNTIAQATDVSVSSDAVEFRYPENHVVVVDRKTGLLLEDSWPDPNGIPRLITLKDHSVLPEGLSYRSALPMLNDMTIQEAPLPQLYNQLYVSFLTELGRQLARRDDLDDLLERHSSKLGDIMKEAGRQMVRSDGDLAGDDDDIRRFRDEFLPSVHDEILKQNPHLAGKMSPEEFLDSLIELARHDRLKLLPPGSEAMIKKVCGPVAILAQVPPDARGPLLKLYKATLPPAMVGGVFELLLVKLERTKLLNAREASEKTVTP